MGAMIVVEHLKKSFGQKDVLKDVTFSVPEGSLMGFVGQNGAGKTTTMKALLGLYKVDGGKVFINGEPVTYGNTATNRFVGYLSDVPQFYDFYTSREYLSFCGEISGMKKANLRDRVEEILDLVGLSGERKRIGGFSRGMKQRLGIAQALLNRPKLLICDEPTSALDPLGRKEVLKLMSAVRNETTILFSTHILSDVERICDRLVVLNDGIIVMSDTVANIKKSHSMGKMVVELKNSSDIPIMMKHYPEASLLDEAKVILSAPGQEERAQILSFLVGQHLDYEKINVSEWNLEDLFMEVIAKK